MSLSHKAQQWADRNAGLIEGLADGTWRAAPVTLSDCRQCDWSFVFYEGEERSSYACLPDTVGSDARPGTPAEDGVGIPADCPRCARR